MNEDDIRKIFASAGLNPDMPVVRAPNLSIPKPARMLSHWGKLTDKKLWRICDELYVDTHRKGDCFFVDADLFCDELLKRGIVSRRMHPAALFTQEALLHALASWRPTQDIVRFDDKLYDCLLSASFDGEMPGDIIRSLPAWSAYIETPRGFEIGGGKVDGFFATLCAQDTLSLVFISEGKNGDDNVTASIVPLEGRPFERFAFMDNDGEVSLNAPDVQQGGIDPKIMAQAMSLVVYLASYGYGDGESHHDGSKAEIAGKKKKGDWRVFPPNRASIREPGAFFVRALKESEKFEGPGKAQADGRSPVRPHMRRAHWHKHRIGPGRERVVARFHFQVMCALHNADKFGLKPGM